MDAAATANGSLGRRLRIVGVLAALYAVAVALGSLPAYGHRYASGIVDLGHAAIPALLDLTDERTAEYVWWLGTLPLELFFVVIVPCVLLTGRGERLALCLFAMYALHWLCLHATTLPAPDRIVWRFPPGVATLGHPFASDFWFSGHVANSFVIALATRGRRPWLRAFTWSGVVFETVLVLATRTHYSIDVVGGFFVGYTTHRLSLDLYPPDTSGRSSPSRRWRSPTRRWPPSAGPPGASSRPPRSHARSRARFSRPRSRSSQAEGRMALAPMASWLPPRRGPRRSEWGAPDPLRRRPRTLPKDAYGGNHAHTTTRPRDYRRAHRQGRHRSGARRGPRRPVGGRRPRAPEPDPRPLGRSPDVRRGRTARDRTSGT